MPLRGTAELNTLAITENLDTRRPNIVSYNCDLLLQQGRLFMGWSHMLSTVIGFMCVCSGAVAAQLPVESEVRQIVSFSFVPGRATEAVNMYRELAIPLYEEDEAMISFRAFREIESPVALDLIVVSAFRGMAGMDRSNSRLSEAGIGAFYGQIGPLISGHTDEFVEMLPSLGFSDPSSLSRTALVWYRILPGQRDAFEDALETTVVPWEERSGVPSATGRFLVSDGWHYLRFLGFNSLGDYQAYWSEIENLSDQVGLASVIAERREVIVALVAELMVR